MVIIGSDNTSNGTGTTNGGTAVAIAADAIKCIIINKWAILNVISATDINVRRQTMNCEIMKCIERLYLKNIYFNIEAFLKKITTLTALTISLIGISNTANAQSGIAKSYCQAYMPVIQQAIQLRKGGVPKSVSEKIANSAYDVNKELMYWLRDIIDLTYEDPNLVINALADGRLLEDCIVQVRGF